MTTVLRGQAAVVTGASRGIGLATSRVLIEGGARVVMIARGAAELEARAHELGESALPWVCDVTDRAAIARAVAHVAGALGGAPDILVNNAGLFTLARLEDTTPADFIGALEVNLLAPFLFVRAFLPEMRTRARGHVITLGSVADRTILPGNVAYAATKFGARALHEVMRSELRGSGVRTTLVSPAATDTTLWDAVHPERHRDLPQRSAMLRAADVADAILWVVTRPAHVNVDELRVSAA